MNYAKQIKELLNITDEQYEAEYMRLYMHWCIDRVRAYVNNPKFHAELQKVMANSAINKYYTDQHNELEYQAVEMLKPQHNKITIGKARELYDIVMADIFKHYPKPLIEAAKKLTIIGIDHDTAAN